MRRSQDLIAFLIVLLVGACVFFPRLGAGSLMGDETIHTYVARQMAQTGDFWPPKSGEELYYNKPPLKILLTAFLFRSAGITETVARIPDALFALGTLVIIYLLVRRSVDPWSALLASVLMATSLDFVHVHGARSATQDSALTFFVTAGLAAYVTLGTKGDRARRFQSIAAGALIGCALWCKGWVALLALLPLPVYELARLRHHGSFGAALRAPLWTALVALLVFLPWSASMQILTDGEYLSFLHRDIWLRNTQGIDVYHTASKGIYPAVVRNNFHLWILAVVFLPRAGARMMRGETGERGGLLAFALIWFVTLVAAYSSSASQLQWYLYPAYPALAVILCILAREAVDWLARWPVLRWGSIAAIALLVAWSCVRVIRPVWSPPRVIDSQRVYRWARRSAVRMLADYDIRWREWNRYYLEPVVSRRLAPGETADGEQADFVLTNSPERWDPTGARITPLKIEVPGEPQVFVVSVGEMRPGW